MLSFLKLHVLLHWFFIYIVVWILEEILLRLFIHWWTKPKNTEMEPTT